MRFPFSGKLRQDDNVDIRWREMLFATASFLARLIADARHPLGATADFDASRFSMYRRKCTPAGAVATPRLFAQLR